MDYQRIILLGNTTAQVEVKQAGNGTKFVQFSVAVARGKDKRVFFPLTIFGEEAEIAGKVLSKGARVLVEGVLDVNQENGRFGVLASTFCRV